MKIQLRKLCRKAIHFFAAKASQLFLCIVGWKSPVLNPLCEKMQQQSRWASMTTDCVTHNIQQVPDIGSEKQVCKISICDVQLATRQVKNLHGDVQGKAQILQLAATNDVTERKQKPVCIGLSATEKQQHVVVTLQQQYSVQQPLPGRVWWLPWLSRYNVQQEVQSSHTSLRPSAAKRTSQNTSSVKFSSLDCDPKASNLILTFFFCSIYPVTDRTNFLSLSSIVANLVLKLIGVSLNRTSFSVSPVSTNDLCFSCGNRGFPDVHWRGTSLWDSPSRTTETLLSGCRALRQQIQHNQMVFQRQGVFTLDKIFGTSATPPLPLTCDVRPLYTRGGECSARAALWGGFHKSTSPPDALAALQVFTVQMWKRQFLAIW